MTTSQTHSGCPVVDFDHLDTDVRLPEVNTVYRTLRAASGPVWSNCNGGFWILSSYDDVRKAAADYARFSSAQRITVPEIPSPPNIPIELDPPQHRPYRKLFSDWLSPRRMADFEPMVRELTEQYVSAFIDNGGGDFVREVAVALPVQIIGRALGLDPELAVRLQDISDKASRGQGEELQDLFGLIYQEVTARRTEPREDFLTEMLSAHIGENPITDTDLVLWLGSAVFAGHDTTLMAGTALIHDLALDTARQTRLRSHPELIPLAVEESLRLNSPVQRFFRTLTEDVQMRGVTMHAGQKVLLIYASANLDHSQFTDPETFDIDRGQIRHVAFGHGVHRCAGAPLAQLELNILAQTMLSKTHFRLTHPPQYGPPTAFGAFLGIDELNITTTP